MEVFITNISILITGEIMSLSREHLDALRAMLRYVDPEADPFLMERNLAWLANEFGLNERGCLRYWIHPLGLRFIATMIENQGGCCCHCQKVMSVDGKRGNIPTIDHLKSLAEGGLDHPDNIGIACWSCNQKRGQETNNVLTPEPKWSTGRYMKNLRYG